MALFKKEDTHIQRIRRRLDQALKKANSALKGADDLLRQKTVKQSSGRKEPSSHWDTMAKDNKKQALTDLAEELRAIAKEIERGKL